MMITWDEAKRLRNLAKHGLDFADFESDFDIASGLVVPAYGERFKIIGRYKGVMIIVVIVSPLGSEAIALVSMRHASKQERTIYGH
jgi:uncharacterized DUF497 family protein